MLVDYFNLDILSGKNMGVLIVVIGLFMQGKIIYKQIMFNVMVKGDLFSLLVGEVFVVIGVEFCCYLIDDMFDVNNVVGYEWGYLLV